MVCTLWGRRDCFQTSLLRLIPLPKGTKRVKVCVCVCVRVSFSVHLAFMIWIRLQKIILHVMNTFASPRHPCQTRLATLNQVLF